ncbi:methyltransferase [Nocardioides sp.]|uniref:methyltransferase n=1 Tax=Nocardioides sp. TaxID=35761 RepID=UPI0035658C54
MSTPAAELMEFGELSIAFDDRVLRPRPWTAAQSHWAAELMAALPAGPALELCAGAGQIGLLAVQRARRAGVERPLVCVDLDPVACDYARRNAEAASLDELVEVRQGRLEEILAPAARFALVIADPPWVPRDRTNTYPEDPLLAIDGGEDGLEVARACLQVAARHLLPGGAVILQVGTLEQVERLRTESTGELTMTEVRHGERGVLVRLDR